MRVDKVTYLTDSLWARLPEISSEREKALQTATMIYYIISNGERKVAVLGLMPMSFISNDYVVWFGLLDGKPPKWQELRMARNVFRLIRAAQPGSTFMAEVADGDEVSARFAEFFGFVPERNYLDRILYKEAN